MAIPVLWYHMTQYVGPEVGSFLTLFLFFIGSMVVCSHPENKGTGGDSHTYTYDT